MKRHRIFALLPLIALGNPPAALEAEVSSKSLEGHQVLDLRGVFNQSMFDDGVADNQAGGWTDEGINDFHVYPPIAFGADLQRGYFFDVVDPFSNRGKNLLMTGMDDHWPALPRSIRLHGFSMRGSHLYLMHSAGRLQHNEADRVMGRLIVEYADGTRAVRDLRNQREIANWYQGRWWSNHEEIRPGAPEILRQSGADPERYRQLGGENFEEAMRHHADAVRWPVTQGFNAVSRNWNIPVVFWALTWAHPHPDKDIVALTLESTGEALLAVAAVTVSDTDFSLTRHTLGRMSAPHGSPEGFFDRRPGGGDTRLDLLLDQPWTRGLRSVELRGEQVVTVRVDHIADPEKLQDPESFLITSPDDPAYRDGLRPLAVNRFSRGSRYREVQPGLYNYLMDHWLHLRMPAPFLPGARYEVRLVNEIVPDAEHIEDRAEFSYDKTPNPGFKLNQVGYSNAATVKHIYFSSYLGDGDPLPVPENARFTIHREEDGAEVFSGPVTLVSERDIQGHDRLYRLDISAFRDSGTFHTRIPGFGRSYSFLNGDPAARAMYDVSHRGMFFQRSGIEITEPHAEKWPRPLAHSEIWVPRKNIPHPVMNSPAFDPRQPEAGAYYLPDGPLPFQGGHYDAGDFDIRPMHIRVAEQLLTLFEAAPEKFYDGQVLIPENNNGIPDLLDEAAWSLLAFEYIQDYATDVRGLDGGVAPGLESYAHPPPGMGHEDPLPYFMRQVTGYFSLSAAACFAHASRLFRPYDAERADRYLERAERAYAYAEANPDEPLPRQADGGMDQGEGWNEGQRAAAWTWAAGHLYAATGKEEYWDRFLANYRQARGSVAGSIPGSAQIWGIAGNDVPIPDPAVREELRNRIIQSGERQLARVEARGRQGYRAATLDGGGWGNTSAIPVNVEDAARAWILTRRQEFLDAVAVSVNFSLGMNPSEMSWMTGAGSVYPMDPTSHNSLYHTEEEEPLPGILIYGPTNYWNDNRVLLYPDKAEMGFYRRVVDTWGMIAQCEYTVWETQAPFLFAVGLLLPDAESGE